MSNKPTFADLIKGDTPVLVDFHATWCGPCKAMAPVLQQVAEEVGKDAKVIKIDIDKNRALAEKLQIKGVPTFIVYHQGKTVWRESGMRSAHELVEVLKGAKVG